MITISFKNRINLPNSCFLSFVEILIKVVRIKAKNIKDK